MIAITIITLSCTWYYHSIKPILVGICVRGASSDPFQFFATERNRVAVLALVRHAHVLARQAAAGRILQETPRGNVFDLDPDSKRSAAWNLKWSAARPGVLGCETDAFMDAGHGASRRRSDVLYSIHQSDTDAAEGGEVA